MQWSWWERFEVRGNAYMNWFCNSMFLRSFLLFFAFVAALAPPGMAASFTFGVNGCAWVHCGGSQSSVVPTNVFSYSDNLTEQFFQLGNPALQNVGASAYSGGRIGGYAEAFVTVDWNMTCSGCDYYSSAAGFGGSYSDDITIIGSPEMLPGTLVDVRFGVDLHAINASSGLPWMETPRRAVQ